MFSIAILICCFPAFAASFYIRSDFFEYVENGPYGIAHIRLTNRSVNFALELLQEVIGNAGVYKIHLRGYDISADVSGMLVDKFVQSSPWWLIRKEIYDQPHTAGADVDENVGMSRGVDVAISESASSHLIRHQILLHRYSTSYEIFLRQLGAIQYPPSQRECGAAPFTIARMIESGWGSQADMFYYIYSQQTHGSFGAFNIWYTKHNFANESMQTCHHDDCGLYPGIINKWECVFLPLTNCSMAEAKFTQCHHPRTSQCFPWEFSIVKNVSSSGQSGAMVEFSRANVGATRVGPQGNYQRQVAANIAHLSKLSGRFGGLPLQRAVMHSTQFMTAHGEIISQRTVEARRVLTLYGLMFRPNYNLRRRSHILITRLVREKLLPPHAYGHPASTSAASSRALAINSSAVPRCAAIHIRRGDRMVQAAMSVDMREYCYIALGNGSISRDNCTSELLEKVDFLGLPPDTDCASLLDKGCFSVHPFGALSLVDYLLKARSLLPGVHDAFVMTDDSAWLEGEVRALPASTSIVSDMRIGRVPLDPNERDSKNGTKYTVDFWASVTLARHCEVFVGHFGSAVAGFVYNAMCFQHGDSTGECPDAADIGD